LKLGGQLEEVEGWSGFALTNGLGLQVWPLEPIEEKVR